MSDADFSRSLVTPDLKFGAIHVRCLSSVTKPCFIQDVSGLTVEPGAELTAASFADFWNKVAAVLSLVFRVSRFWKAGAWAKFCPAGTAPGRIGIKSSDSPRCCNCF